MSAKKRGVGENCISIYDSRIDKDTAGLLKHPWNFILMERP
jgi:hypothetical protein